MSRRSMRTQVEWKVATQRPCVSSSSSEKTRSRISAAALFVKVTARISQGRARPLPISQAMRCVSMRVLPLPAPASTSRGPSVWRTASACSGFSPAMMCSGSGNYSTVTLFARLRG